MDDAAVKLVERARELISALEAEEGEGPKARQLSGVLEDFLLGKRTGPELNDMLYRCRLSEREMK